MSHGLNNSIRPCLQPVALRIKFPTHGLNGHSDNTPSCKQRHRTGTTLTPRDLLPPLGYFTVLWVDRILICKNKVLFAC